MGTNITDGNIDRMGVVQFAFNPASVAAQTAVEQTVTILGLLLGDVVMVRKPTVSAGLGIGGARVSAVNTVAITLVNASIGAVDAPLETYTLTWFRPYQGVALPTGVLA